MSAVSLLLPVELRRANHTASTNSSSLADVAMQEQYLTPVMELAAQSGCQTCRPYCPCAIRANESELLKTLVFLGGSSLKGDLSNDSLADVSPVGDQLRSHDYLHSHAPARANDRSA